MIITEMIPNVKIWFMSHFSVYRLNQVLIAHVTTRIKIPFSSWTARVPRTIMMSW